MDAKKFVLSYYKYPTRNFHITRISAPQEALNLHSHNYFQIYYVIRGAIIHHIKNSSAKLTSGDVFILPPNLPHYIEVPRETLIFIPCPLRRNFFKTEKSNKLILDFLYYLKTETAESLHVEENKQRVMYCVDYIKNHFKEEITLAEIVHLSAMSKTCFCSIFTATTGTPFKEYLNRYRIERAAELIASGEKVSVVGSCCGYGDFSTFYQNFKKGMGM